MKKSIFTLLLVSVLACLFLISSSLRAADQPSAPAKPQALFPIDHQLALKYKLISGYKQPFNDELQLHLSNGWVPVGGVSVTVWNNDLYFAQLISKKAE